MTKIKVERQGLLATSNTRDNVTVKSFKDSEIKDGRLFNMNMKTGSVISGEVKIGSYLYTQKNSKITARFMILEVE